MSDLSDDNTTCVTSGSAHSLPCVSDLGEICLEENVQTNAALIPAQEVTAPPTTRRIAFPQTFKAIKTEMYQQTCSSRPLSRSCDDHGGRYSHLHSSRFSAIRKQFLSVHGPNN